MKQKKIVIYIITIIIVGLSFILLKKDAIFQRGNPIPYITAMTKLSTDNKFIAVNNEDNTYISLNGDCPSLFKFFENTYNVEFVEQAGSGYIFTDGTQNYVISSEIYWGKYKVWTLPEMSERIAPSNIMYGITAEVRDINENSQMTVEVIGSDENFTENEVVLVELNSNTTAKFNVLQGSMIAITYSDFVKNELQSKITARQIDFVVDK